MSHDRKAEITKADFLELCDIHIARDWPAPSSSERIFISSGFLAEETLILSPVAPHCEVRGETFASEASFGLQDQLL